MSTERILAVHARSRTSAKPRQPRTPGQAGRAAAGQSTLAAARPYSDRPRIRAVTIAAALVLAPVLMLATVLLWSLHSAAHQSVTSQSAAIDPRLILQPRTVAQTVQINGLRLTLTASPLVPGSNRFVMQLSVHGRPLIGAHVLQAVRMIGMAMRPITLPMSEVRPGRYAATGALAMFGRWRVTMQIDRPGTVSLSHQFTVSVDLPFSVNPKITK